ncbi:glycoside hydrolase family 97 protein [Proteiniphilum sp.]|uniref:glycoside hydrolase family 97 protein n=1 Tax=Proteiniphilum sp. TaxID=1926877 RepID=UPI0033290D48
MQPFKLIFVFVFLFSVNYSFAGKQYTLSSPNGKIQVDVSVGQSIEYTVKHISDVLIAPSPISMELDNGIVWGVDPKLQKASNRTVNEVIPAIIYKKKEVADHFNELTLTFKGDYRVIFRAYDDGIAYRFVSTSKKPFRVKSEQAVFNFPSDCKAYIPYVREDRIDSFEKQFFNSFENVYAYTHLSAWDKRRYAFSPLLIETGDGKKICLTEADLINYPGMYFYNGDGSNSLKGVFAPYPKEVKQGGHNELQMLVQSRENYIAAYDKGTGFPWRTVIIAENDYELADNDMVYKLATPTVDMDFSWVKPGKVAWDWWNDWNLYDVDFRAGINNETYKYYIDFASKYGIEYVILDEGWAVNKQADLFQVIPEIDLPDLAAYAKTKNVDLILWAGYHAFDRDMERVCKHYSEMGIKGFKVDFMDRDDQYMVDFHRRGAEMAAKYKLLIDYHGTYKPTGLHRTYPNVINFEGVHGLEQMKWSAPSVDQVTYDVTIPFIRQVAGPMDYTQGAMRNATKNNYRPVNSEAMSQGTRCRQLAQYIIFESPLNMLCDNPSNYETEKECTEFIASIPTVWDETRALNGKVGQYVSIARKSGNDWYVGSMTDWDARDMELDLSFLGKGDYKAVIFRDGVNADRVARDYKKETITIPDNRKLTIKMAPGGGWIARIYR